MTNGEKIKEIFPDTKIITQYDNPFGDRFMVFTLNNEDMQVNIEWWNAEYKEPTTKNDCETCIHNKGVLECDMYGCKYEPTTKNNLAIDCISRADARSLVCKIGRKNVLGMSGKTFQDLYKGIDDLPSVTPVSPIIDWNNCHTSEQLDSIATTKNDLGVDLISRKAVLDITWQDPSYTDPLNVLTEVRDKIKDLPIVTPQEPRWIPVSERLPKAEYGESDSVLVCFEDETQDVLYFNGSNWCYPTGETYISVNHKNGWHNKVIAWMPLPKPYEPQESEDKE